MRFVLLLISILFLSTLHTQEEVLSFVNEDMSRRLEKESFTMVNSNNKDLAIIIIERKDLYAYLFDSASEKISNFLTSSVKYRSNKIHGFSISENSYSVLYSNLAQEKFVLQVLDFNSKKSFTKEIDLDFKKGELFLSAINYNNNLYVLSGNKDLELKLRKLNNKNSFDLVKTYLLEEINNKNSLVKNKISFEGLLTIYINRTGNLTKIDQRVPNSIERTSNSNKLYQNKENIYFTFDNNEQSTVLYTINLNSFDISLNIYPYPKSKIGTFKKFNSFLFEDKLFQVASSRNEMIFEIKNLKGELLKDYYISRDNLINFKNTPIIQEGQTTIPFVNTRKLEQTQKYLRKITAGNLGINVQKVKDLYYVTLGGYKVLYNSIVIPSSNMTYDGFISYNPTYNSYQDYGIKRSTYFNTKLNSEFNHVSGELEKNDFDRITLYKDNVKHETAEDVFYLDGKLHFGFFNLKDQTYNLIKF